MCPGTSTPSSAHQTVSLYLCNSESNARGKSRALEGRCVSSKNPSRVRDGDEGVAGRNRREKHIPAEGSLICPQANQLFCTKRKQKKIELVAQRHRREGGGPDHLRLQLPQGLEEQPRRPQLSRRSGLVHLILIRTEAAPLAKGQQVH